jgi:hypothetical protein
MAGINRLNYLRPFNSVCDNIIQGIFPSNAFYFHRLAFRGKTDRENQPIIIRLFITMLLSSAVEPTVE